MNIVEVKIAMDRIALVCKFLESYGETTRCKRKPVGCGVFTPACDEIVAMAYNGPPSGMKPRRCKGDDPCGCVHGEIKAMNRMDARRYAPRSLIIYTSAAPCVKCAQAVIDSGAIGIWIYKPTWYPTGPVEALLVEGGIYFVSQQVLELFDGQVLHPRFEEPEFVFPDNKNPDELPVWDSKQCEEAMVALYRHIVDICEDPLSVFLP